MASSTLGAPGLTSFEPTPSGGVSRQDVIAECLGCIVSGRPLPEHMRPRATTLGVPPATVEEGIARILRGPVGG